MSILLSYDTKNITSNICRKVLALLVNENYNYSCTSMKGLIKVRKIFIFIEKNKLIAYFFMISLFIIVSYIWTMEQPELFYGAEKIYNLFFQLAIGYIINFMFYTTQVYIPNERKELTVKRCISKRIEKLIDDMNESLSKLSSVYVGGDFRKSYTDEDLDKIFNRLRFSDKVNVLITSLTTRDKFVYYSVRGWLIKCITDTENDIDNLYNYYPADISMDLMEILEEILNSKYHLRMKTLLAVPNDVNFSTSKQNFFIEYYHLIIKLENIKKKDYF